MPTNLLILPLLGGFCLVHYDHRFRYKAQRQDGYRLLIQCAIAGVILLAVSRLVVVLLTHSSIGEPLKAAWAVYAPIPYLGTGTGALILGFLLPQIDNFLVKRSWWISQQKWILAKVGSQFKWFKATSESNSEYARNDEIIKHGSGLARLFHFAEKEKLLVSITLSNRKWYVGLVAEAWNLDPLESCLRLLPVLSGYRNSDDLSTEVLINYGTVYKDPNVDASKFIIAIPLKDIQIANLFDESVYQQHFAPVSSNPAKPGS